MDFLREWLALPDIRESRDVVYEELLRDGIFHSAIVQDRNIRDDDHFIIIELIHHQLHGETHYFSFPFFVFAGVRRRFVSIVRDFKTRKCFPNSEGVSGLGASGAGGLRVDRQNVGRTLGDSPTQSLHYRVSFAV
jgi:hypothetical protein